MTTHAQLSAFEAALERPQPQPLPEPRLEGLAALGRSYHGGATPTPR